ncbi:hypothetical protein EOL96_06165 [Candidatus Saccharibacteria bacterium]|jgi:hypothetical protein|nr:hypothetical protein [Candidatus Saccharibacteria bacterium]
MAGQQVRELIEKAANSEQYFTTLSTQARIEMIAVLVVDQIIADIDNGGFLLEEIKNKGDKSNVQSAD